VKRTLIRSSAFVRAAKRLLKKRPDVVEDLQAALELLSEDTLHPKLKTHKLKGDFEGSWAASAGYDLRIVFEIVDYKGSEAILLLTVGTHDEVY
jgi:addiction module RelE/StbE family toxin